MTDSVLIDVYVQHLAEMHMTLETHDAFSVYIIIITLYAKFIFPWHLVSLSFTEMFFLVLFYATSGSHVRLSTLFILITITDVRNLFSAAPFVFYGFT